MSPATAARARPPARAGRWWAYAGAVLGGAVSIAANVAHSYVPPERLPAGVAPGEWHPATGAVFGAVFWPVALFVAVEILARIVWPAGRRWAVLRYAGLLPVSLVAAVVSYRHLSGLLAFYGEDALTATIGPLAVDGLMVMATGALIATAPRRAASPAVSAPPAAPAGPTPPAASADASTSTGTRAPRTGTPPARRTGTSAGTRTDAELIELLAAVRREPDGTVPVRRAAAALACGPDRARRLLRAEGLLRASAADNPSPIDRSEPRAA